MKKHVLTLLTLTALVTFGFSAIVAAQSGNGNAGSETGNGLGSSSSSSSSNGKKLGADELKECQNREQTINSYMLRIGDRVQKQEQLFTNIADRVKQYYADNNLSVENYTELVTAVEGAEAQVQTSYQAMNQYRNAFRCNGEDPKGVALQFRSELQGQTDDLKAYKNAVRNLLVAVKTAAEAQEGV